MLSNKVCELAPMSDNILTQENITIANKATVKQGIVCRYNGTPATPVRDAFLIYSDGTTLRAKRYDGTIFDLSSTSSAPYLRLSQEPTSVTITTRTITATDISRGLISDTNTDGGDKSWTFDTAANLISGLGVVSDYTSIDFTIQANADRVLLFTAAGITFAGSPLTGTTIECPPGTTTRLSLNLRSSNTTGIVRLLSQSTNTVHVTSIRWLPITYNASHFVAGGGAGGTVSTVAPSSYSYYRVGKTFFFNISATGWSVVTNTIAYVDITIPAMNGLTCSGNTENPCFLITAGTESAGRMIVFNTLNIIRVRRLGAGTTMAVGALEISGQIQFVVN